MTSKFQKKQADKNVALTSKNCLFCPQIMSLTRAKLRDFIEAFEDRGTIDAPVIHSVLTEDFGLSVKVQQIRQHRSLSNPSCPEAIHAWKKKAGIQ